MWQTLAWLHHFTDMWQTLAWLHHFTDMWQTLAWLHHFSWPCQRHMWAFAKHLHDCIINFSHCNHLLWNKHLHDCNLVGVYGRSYWHATNTCMTASLYRSLAMQTLAWHFYKLMTTNGNCMTASFYRYVTNTCMTASFYWHVKTSCMTASFYWYVTNTWHDCIILLTCGRTCMTASFYWHVTNTCRWLYKDCSFRPDAITNMVATGNSCFWLVDF